MLSRIRVALAVAAAVGLAPAVAAAQSAPATGFYLKGSAGLSFGQDMALDPTHEEFSFDYDFDAGSSFIVAAGYWITPSVAVELEGAQRRSEAEVHAAYNEDLTGAIDRWTFDETVKARSVMVNVVYSINLADRADRLRPYVGAGIGRAKVEFGSDDTGWEPAWQLFGGFARPLSAQLDLLGEVRWFKAQGGVFLDPDTSYETGGGFESVDVSLGLAYRF